MVLNVVWSVVDWYSVLEKLLGQGAGELKLNMHSLCSVQMYKKTRLCCL